VLQVGRPQAVQKGFHLAPSSEPALLHIIGTWPRRSCPRACQQGKKLLLRQARIAVRYVIKEDYEDFVPMQFPPDDRSSVYRSLVCGPSPLLLQWRDVIPVVLFRVK